MQDVMHDEPAEPELTDDQRALLEGRLISIGLALADKRQKAIDGRAESGIEQEWTEDEEFYEGIDDANRSEHLNAMRSKPMGEVEAGGKKTSGSTIFLNITRPYVDAASARVGDMLLPTDDKAWAMKPTPIADMVSLAEGKIPRQIQVQIEKKFPDKEARQQEYQRIKTEAKVVLDEAKEKAEKAETRIEDWHVQCQYHAEMRKVIESCSKTGSGILKGPIMEKVKTMAYMEGALILKEDLQPASRQISYWNLYPDPGCGDNIHRGAYVFEKDDIPARELENLQGLEGYLDDQIMQVLKEGPLEPGGKVNSDRPELGGLRKRQTKDLYQIWYFHGRMDKDDLIACGCEVGEDYMAMDVKVTMVNNHVIRVVPNKLDTGEFPYDIMVWQPRENSPWGIGVARQIRVPQRIVNGAARRMMDNAGLASTPMYVFPDDNIYPENGIYEIVGGKIWRVKKGVALGGKLDDLIGQIKLDILQVELQAIIEMGLKLAEDTTGLPMIMQGQMGQAPDTVGGMTILNNNSSSLLRRLAKLYDDRITEPHVRRYYRYLLQYGEDEEKGDFQIDARGSSALVERDIKNQSIIQLGQHALNPVFGLDPKKWMKEYLKSQRLDAKAFEYDDEEWKKVVENMQQPKGDDPRREIAQLNAELALQKMEYEKQEKEKDRELEYILKTMEEEVNIQEINAKAQGERAINFDSIKQKLSDTAMKLRTQKELALVKTAAPQVARPAIEPKGRAPNGQAFQK